MQPLKLISLVVVLINLQNVFADIPSCGSEVYCEGDLLKTVQMAKLFPDSKTFVDMEMKHDESVVLKNFNSLKCRTNNNPSRKDIQKFVHENFQPGNELEPWIIPDFNPNPPLLDQISNQDYRMFATSLVQLWTNFSRILKPDVFVNPARYSIIPVRNGFVVPGGRFREFYYWDSYWIMKGLLASGMHETVKGMIENFLFMVEKYGFVPNGGRIYYLNRSQPPLLNLMVYEYLKKTNNIPWLKQNVHLLQRELKYWLETQTITFDFEGKHTLAHYAVNSPSPRPESYSEDVSTCSKRKTDEEMKNCYRDLKSGAETGWDFSSRWLFNKDGSFGTSLNGIETRRVVPVDLNSFLAQAFDLVANYSGICGDEASQRQFTELRDAWRKSINAVFYDKSDGMWYDFDLELGRHRKGFYPSNLTPLWCKLYDNPEYGDKAVEYLTKEGILKFPGGTPTSLLRTGEQWDLPNAWPPLQSIVILGLKRSGGELALRTSEELARKWLDNNLVIYNNTGFMYEKYDAESKGAIGGGGEYSVQTGFGWSNGVIFELIEEFFSSRKSP